MTRSLPSSEQCPPSGCCRHSILPVVTLVLEFFSGQSRENGFLKPNTTGVHTDTLISGLGLCDVNRPRGPGRRVCPRDGQKCRVPDLVSTGFVWAHAPCPGACHMGFPHWAQVSRLPVVTTKQIPSLGATSCHAQDADCRDCPKISNVSHGADVLVKGSLRLQLHRCKNIANLPPSASLFWGSSLIFNCFLLKHMPK